ncbi:MAG: hypothetical protein FIA92_17155 [Chloroflexi bacterium]|nr:hypothetical protein [Chloroflexota bacterium]
MAMDFALGYIDPGSGSLLIQVLIASALAVPYFLRTQIRRAVSAVRDRGKAKAEEAPTPEYD